MPTAATFDEGPSIFYDRRVSPALFAELAEGGVFHPLVDMALDNRARLDLQLRAVDGKRSSATLYCGLTALLTIKSAGSRPLFELATHATHKRNDFDAGWTSQRPAQDWRSEWPRVMSWLKAAEPKVGPRHFDKEGKVQMALSRAASDFCVVDKEAVIGFSALKDRRKVVDNLQSRLTAALESTLGARGQQKNFGKELDLLAVEKSGRVLVIEVKPSDASEGLARSPAQVEFYTLLFREWAASLRQKSFETIKGMMQQRISLGLSEDIGSSLRNPLEFVPVVAAGFGQISPLTMERMAEVRKGLTAGGLDEPDFQLWQVSEEGSIQRLKL